MKKIAFIFMALMLTACTCFAGVFKNFEEEKKFCVNTAWEKVKSLGEVPVSWRSDLSYFSKSDTYTAATVVVNCKGKKIAYCFVQFVIDKAWFSDDESVRVINNTATVTHSLF